MNRRNFLKALAAGAVAVALPGQRAHAWDHNDLCESCRARRIEVEDGLVPLNCTGVARRIFLPPRRPVRMLGDYLTDNTAWFLKTDNPDGIALFNRAHLCDPCRTVAEEEFECPSLSEHSLEELLIEIKEQADKIGKPLSFIPRFVVWRPLR